MSTIGERLKEVRKTAKLNQEQFAKTLGISRGHISNIEKGTDSPSSSLVKLLYSTYNVSEDWFLYGNGEMALSWDIRTDEGALSKYNMMKMIFEKELRNSTGEDLKSMVQAMGYLTGALDARDLAPVQAAAYRKAICSIIDELEKLTFMVSSSTKPSKTDAMKWTDFKNSCLAATDRIHQSVKDAVNVYLEKYGEEMKL